MFGFIGAALFGIIYAGAQISDSNASKNLREKARQSGSEGYFDVNGVRRHTSNGRRYTREELHREMFPETLEERLAKRDREIHDMFDNIYYGVDSPTEFLETEVFLTEEEARKYLEENRNIKCTHIFKVSKWQIEKGIKKYNRHF